ncbi:MAG TPA: flagellar hook-associated protein FlgK [Acidobacteriaceae bacterium]|jgi:flagellar hook-associated protein 1 FlgK|nr:flagellar hook-associated protein FlgK [Acidobacteriaceae bacterium]
MATLNSALQIITGALTADQAALNITANNTANASTPGYTREIPIWESNDPVTINGISYGQGVQVVQAQSQRSLVLNANIEQQQQAQQATNSEWTALQGVEGIFNQVTSSTSGSSPGSLGDMVTSFFNSVSALENDPDDTPTRDGVLSAATSLAQTFNSDASQLQAQTSSLNEQVGGIVEQINPLLNSIAQLNQQISSTSPNADAGQLEDQRQQDIQQLSQYIGINTVSTENNGLTITTTSGALLVSEGQAYQLTTGNVNGNVDVFTSAPGNVADITTAQASGGGQLAGLLTTRDQDIPSAMNSIDTLAYNLATQVNAVQTAGSDQNGNPGVALFNIPGTVAGSAAGISVAITDPSQIAAAGAGLGPGDNSNAAVMANLQNQSIVGGQTATNYYASFISSLGSQVSGLDTQNTAQQASLTQLQTQQSALSSVSLNDEASNLQTYEQAYQSAAQFFNVLNTVMTSALNLGVETAVE